jgi:hypothetical protein
MKSIIGSKKNVKQQELVIDKNEELLKEKVILKEKNNTEQNCIVLTQEQQLVYDQLINFLKSDKERELLLVGYAGTGKTTLVAKFINDIIRTGLSKKIVMAAPTHKAVNIAKSKLFGSKEDFEQMGKIINIMTVHRLLNYQSYIGQEGERFFAKGKIDPNWSIYDLVVVDECSMLSNQIITDIKGQLKKNALSGVKILYVGDPAQLPPVNQSDSKIFDGSVRTLVLDKIIRTSNNKIIELSNSHRKWIFTKNQNDIPHVGEYESDAIKLYSTANKETKKWLDNFIELLKMGTKENKIISEFDDIVIKNQDLDPDMENDNKYDSNIILDHDKMIDNHNNNIILTWTNKKSNLYNQYIREKIFNKKNLSQWEIGEILIFNDFHRKEIIDDVKNELDHDLDDDLDEGGNKSKSKTKQIDIVSFYTSEQVKLVGIKQIKYKIGLLKFKINNNLTSEINDKFRSYYKKINSLLDWELDVYEMMIQKIVDLMEGKMCIPEYTIYTLHTNSEKKYNDMIEMIEILITKLKSSCHKKINKIKNKDNNIKCELQSEVEKKINRLYKEYQTIIVDCFAQLNYGYCITVHKSQGSTFKNVFIDMNDILDNNNMNETSRCLYTSITRTSKTLNLLI